MGGNHSSYVYTMEEVLKEYSIALMRRFVMEVMTILT